MTRKRTMTRRRFLTGMGAAAAGLHFVPAAVLGRDGAVAPSDRVTMGFIGVGTQGRGHLLGGAWTYVTGGYVARKDVHVLAVCDTWRQRREDACARVNSHYAERSSKGSYAACKTYVDFRKVLARKDIDAVLIGTPIHWHAIMSIMAAEAGKDVYCEKPTAVTLRESRTLAEAVARYGRIYQAGTQQRSEYDGKFRRALEFVLSGRIGKLKSIMLLGDIAERLRRRLKWDPARERFVGDDEANRLLSAAKRPPWRV